MRLVRWFLLRVFPTLIDTKTCLHRFRLVSDLYARCLCCGELVVYVGEGTYIGLHDIQQDQRRWQEHNFPGRESWVPLLGVVEELGEIAHAYIKKHQGIRIQEDHTAKLKDGAADLVIFLCDFASSMGFDLEEEVRRTWAVVKQRDWKANPVTGRK